MLSAPIYALSTSQIKNQLFNQIALGEAKFRFDIVKEALSKLELINPNDPKVISAQIRLLVFEHKLKLAKKKLHQLQKLAPQSPYYRKMATLIYLNEAQGAKALLQANILVLSSNYPAAKKALDKLYRGNPPSLRLAIEYWRISAKIPKFRTQALHQLLDIYNHYQKLGLFKTRGAEKLKWPLNLKKNISNIYVDEGRVQLKHQQLSSAMNNFKQALSFNPQNYLAYNGLGDIAFSKKQFKPALSYYKQAIAIDPNGNLAHQNVVSVLAKQSPELALNYISSLSPFLQQKLNNRKKQIESAMLSDKALEWGKKGDWKKAIALYHQALTYSPDDIWTAYRLAIAYAKTGQSAVGKAQLDKLASSNAKNPSFTYAYALYCSKINQNYLAMRMLQSLSRSQWTTNMHRLYDSLVMEKQKAKARQYADEKQWNKALHIYQRLYQRFPNDVWLIYDYAQALNASGSQSKAILLFKKLSKSQPANPQQAYAYALFLSKLDKYQAARAKLNTIAPQNWSQSMHKLAKQLQENSIIAKANTLRARGNTQQAYEYLSHQPVSLRILLTLGRWSLSDGDLSQAQDYYQRALRLSPQSISAKIGLIETYVQDNKNRLAESMLEALQSKVQQLPLDEQRSIANAWFSLKNYAKALSIYRRLILKASSSPPNQDKALILRDAANMDTTLLQPKLAKTNLQWAMLQSGITNSLPQDDLVYTTLSRENPQDDWLKRSIRSQAAKLYKQQSHIATLETDFWQLRGEPGRSDYQAIDTILHYKEPLRDGMFFIRGDFVSLSAGRFASANGIFFDEFGTCSIGCRRDFNQSDSGFGIMSGWYNENWYLNLGVTPVGFAIVNPIVELSYSSSFHNIGWTLSALHTPLTNSLLSFSGSQDPNTGITWGGVTSSGFNLALSYDRGGKHGLWSNALGSFLNGKNVVDNYRIELMGGYYYKIINQYNRRLSIGLSAQYWHYQKDLNRYTLGSGGYFSPQRFITVSIPLSYRQRSENWSLMIETSIGQNTTTTDDVLLYPLPSITPASLTNPNPVRSGSTAKTKSYYFLLGIERRLSSHFRLGGIVDIQRSPDFAPNHALVYLRYTLEPWQGDLDMPLQPILPYTIYR